MKTKWIMLVSLSLPLAVQAGTITPNVVPSRTSGVAPLALVGMLGLLNLAQPRQMRHPLRHPPD